MITKGTNTYLLSPQNSTIIEEKLIFVENTQKFDNTILSQML